MQAKRYGGTLRRIRQQLGRAHIYQRHLRVRGAGGSAVLQEDVEAELLAHLVGVGVRVRVRVRD